LVANGAENIKINWWGCDPEVSDILTKLFVLEKSVNPKRHW
jgi:hypothetical protein